MPSDLTPSVVFRNSWKPSEHSGLLRTSHLHSLLNPEIKLSLLQIPTFLFVSPHCVSDTHKPVLDEDKFEISVQFISVAQLCLTLCEPMDCSTPGFLAHHQLRELTQTRVLARQLSYPMLSPSPPDFNFSQCQGLFQWVSSSDLVAKVLEFQLQHQTFQWIFRTDFL